MTASSTATHAFLPLALLAVAALPASQVQQASKEDIRIRGGLKTTSPNYALTGSPSSIVEPFDSGKWRDIGYLYPTDEPLTRTFFLVIWARTRFQPALTPKDAIAYPIETVYKWYNDYLEKHQCLQHGFTDSGSFSKTLKLAFKILGVPIKLLKWKGKRSMFGVVLYRSHTDEISSYPGNLMSSAA